MHATRPCMAGADNQHSIGTQSAGSGFQGMTKRSRDNCPISGQSPSDDPQWILVAATRREPADCDCIFIEQRVSQLGDTIDCRVADISYSTR